MADNQLEQEVKQINQTLKEIGAAIEQIQIAMHEVWMGHIQENTTDDILKLRRIGLLITRLQDIDAVAKVMAREAHPDPLVAIGRWAVVKRDIPVDQLLSSLQREWCNKKDRQDN